jgi:hypothetical protein
MTSLLDSVTNESVFNALRVIIAFRRRDNVSSRFELTTPLLSSGHVDCQCSSLANNIELFRPGRELTPVQMAATIPEKLQIKPGLGAQALVDWCRAWIRTQDTHEKTFERMEQAFEEEKQKSPAGPPFHGPYTLKSLQTNCSICMNMLRALPVPQVPSLGVPKIWNACTPGHTHLEPRFSVNA